MTTVSMSAAAGHSRELSQDAQELNAALDMAEHIIKQALNDIDLFR
mgnify:CR=1 FL=1